MRFVMRQPEIVVRLPRNGFVPLENMNVEIHVMDQNGDANCEFRVKLIKVNRSEDLSQIWTVSFEFFRF